MREVSKAPLGRGKACISYLDMGPIPIHVGFSACPSAFRKEVLRLGVEDLSPFVIEGAPATMHTFTACGETTCIVCIDPEQSAGMEPIAVAGLLCHEAVHVMQKCAAALREPNGLSSEMQAYIVQWVAQFCMGEWRDTLKPGVTDGDERGA